MVETANDAVATFSIAYRVKESHAAFSVAYSTKFMENCPAERMADAAKNAVTTFNIAAGVHALGNHALRQAVGLLDDA